ncbi:MAG TPA: cobalt-precorrin-2 C(20)-methyltransferase [Spirochaetes bacterium]|nr:cobalt-precorrin-2 C(20)-methyltransferase [Spirochaetota bacterium]
MKKLYMVSLGPGAPELITIQAALALLDSEIIYVPSSSSDGSFTQSRAYTILQGFNRLAQKTMTKSFESNLTEFKAVYSPRKYKKEDWIRQTQQILEGLKEKDTVAFVTLGDAAIYSTVYFLLDILKEKGMEDLVQVLPGITSFSQASARIQKPLCLGDSRLEIIPLHPSQDEKHSKVYMRPKVGESLSDLEEEGEIVSFENLNFENENFYNGCPEKVKGYMTLVIDFAKLSVNAHNRDNRLLTAKRT